MREVDGTFGYIMGLEDFVSGFSLFFWSDYEVSDGIVTNLTSIMVKVPQQHAHMLVPGDLVRIPVVSFTKIGGLQKAEFRNNASQFYGLTPNWEIVAPSPQRSNATAKSNRDLNYKALMQIFDEEEIFDDIARIIAEFATSDCFQPQYGDRVNIISDEKLLDKFYRFIPHAPIEEVAETIKINMARVHPFIQRTQVRVRAQPEREGIIVRLNGNRCIVQFEKPGVYGTVIYTKQSFLKNELKSLRKPAWRKKIKTHRLAGQKGRVAAVYTDGSSSVYINCTKACVIVPTIALLPRRKNKKRKKKQKIQSEKRV